MSRPVWTIIETEWIAGADLTVSLEGCEVRRGRRGFLTPERYRVGWVGNHGERTKYFGGNLYSRPDQTARSAYEALRAAIKTSLERGCPDPIPEEWRSRK